MKKITYSSHYITNKDLISVNRQLQSEFITRGPATDKFEREINKVTNSKFCAVTNSATASLIISCKALDLKKMI